MVPPHSSAQKQPITLGGQFVAENVGKYDWTIAPRQVAVYLDVDTPLISIAVRVKRNPNRERMLQVSLLLNITVEYLISFWQCVKIKRVFTCDKYVL